MWNKPTDAQLAKLPSLYSTKDTPWEKTVIYEHFFLGGSDWYAAEYGHEDRLFFGYAILNADFQNAEWGHFSLDELAAISIRGHEVDRDRHWKVRPASEIENIVRGMTRRG